ncbi:hypothetical protein LIER_27717 [Lithospermum erythrorhizon]|uniref:Uncharacterized protein n=1 Tax=Lithospermum erythrorhizon TaxID=34254 RepID=A0AAV3RDC3_LITER
MGDFNDILCHEEKNGGNTRTGSMAMFRDFVRQCGLLDLGFSGHPLKIEDIQSKIKEAFERGTLDGAEVRSLEFELDRAWEEKEVYWKERAKFKLLKEGARNTKFFHATAMIRRRTNRILGIEDGEGFWQEGEGRVEREVLRYFEEIFSANIVCHPEKGTQSVDHRVTKEMNRKLTRVVTGKEVKRVVFEMPANKSP